MSSRPTFNAAKATETQGGYKRYVPSHTQSVYLMPSHTVLKTRQIGQGNEEEIKHKDLKKELQEREQLVQKKKNNQSSTIIPAIEEEKNKDIIEEIVEEETEEFTKVPKSNYDDSDDDLNTSSDSDSDGDSDNDELIKELERVKRAKEEKERLATQERALTSNPLLKPISSKKDDDDEDSFTVKRKWTDSTIFKNQANDSNQQKKKRFINDTTRNDNHKQFMYEYMK
ncbi:Cwf15/Cwc15 cell cycle control protein [Naegleria gruberi]|uniref:Cwf15/Cwc15 cell cycle control protein n=1 Tax=Naegleria gruberi TaxID=5762 RepID=D2V0R1_NAEGR|nr:Cwf15/Cwc15 cell cycle control protein [Naegleria gruberi]EFC49771.1 Cwf15/Cwc15 cell cycle control protein [Naegleria gruberi]|eukprot:XP_002682515.1 Cwf15/Cwc15 cell cycle control protein [Naegleria gruberi strain NEG-M]